MTLESNSQQTMQKKLKAAGFFSRKISAENSRGLPDLLIVGHGVTALVEVKKPTGTVSKIQARTMKEIKKHGGHTEVWWNLADCERFIRETTGSC